MQIIDARGLECLNEALRLMKMALPLLKKSAEHVAAGTPRDFLAMAEPNLREAACVVNATLKSALAHEEFFGGQESIRVDPITYTTSEGVIGEPATTSLRYPQITVDSGQMGGVPCVRHLRIPVSVIVGAYANGLNDAEILRDFPDLTTDDLRAAVEYAIEIVNRSRELL